MTDQGVPGWVLERIGQVAKDGQAGHERVRKDLNESVGETREELKEIRSELRQISQKLTRLEVEREMEMKTRAKMIAFYTVGFGAALQILMQLGNYLVNHRTI